MPVRNERQVIRMLSGTAGELIVLVERDLDHMEEQEEFDGTIYILVNIVLIFRRRIVSRQWQRRIHLCWRKV